MNCILCASHQGGVDHTDSGSPCQKCLDLCLFIANCEETVNVGRRPNDVCLVCLRDSERALSFVYTHKGAICNHCFEARGRAPKQLVSGANILCSFCYQTYTSGLHHIDTINSTTRICSTCLMIFLQMMAVPYLRGVLVPYLARPLEADSLRTAVCAFCSSGVQARKINHDIGTKLFVKEINNLKWGTIACEHCLIKLESANILILPTPWLEDGLNDNVPLYRRLAILSNFAAILSRLTGSRSEATECLLRNLIRHLDFVDESGEETAIGLQIRTSAFAACAETGDTLVPFLAEILLEPSNFSSQLVEACTRLNANILGTEGFSSEEVKS